MKKTTKWAVFIMLILAAIAVAASPVFALTNINACGGTYTTNNEVYNLTQSIVAAAGTCLIFDVNNSILEGNGFQITAASGDAEDGIALDDSINFTINNLKVTSDGTSGTARLIRAERSYGWAAQNVTINNLTLILPDKADQGLAITEDIENGPWVVNNFVCNATAASSGSHAEACIFATRGWSGNYGTLTINNAAFNSPNGAPAIPIITERFEGIIIKNGVIASAFAPIQFNDPAVQIMGTTTINFTNVTWSETFTFNINGNYYNKWWGDITVRDAKTNAVIPGANVNAVNITGTFGTLSHQGTTNANGLARLELEEYFKNSTITVGLGNWNVTASASGYSSNSTMVNVNATNPGNVAVTIYLNDVGMPIVTNVLPQGATYDPSTVVTISANVTDSGSGIDKVIANVTLPNSTIRQLQLNLGAGNIYSNTFSETSLSGLYSITIIANDTAGNVNSNGKGNFTISAPAGASCGTLTSSTTLSSNVNSNGTCFTINANNVVLDCAGYTIAYGNTTSQTHGIYASGKSNVTIKNCIIKQTNAAKYETNGIRLASVSNSLIQNNTFNIFSSESNAVYITGGSGNTITKNIISGLVLWSIGVYLSGGSGNSVTNNSISAPTGVYTFLSNSNTVSQNNITSGMLGIQTFMGSSSNLTINNVTSSEVGISVIAGSNNKVINNTITATQIGLTVVGYGSYSNTLEGNNAKGIFAYGMQIDSHNNVLKNNIGTSTNGVGIEIAGFDAYGNTLTGNIGNSTSGTGISLFTTYQNNLTNNIAISSSGTALSLLQAYNNTLTGTNATSNTGTAISFMFSNNINNIFKDTTIKTNSTWLYHSTYSSGNKFTNTKFDALNGSVEFSYFGIPGGEMNVTASNFNISFNKVSVNSTKLPVFETNAKISLKGITFASPSMLVDKQDNGTFETCISPKCINISYSAGTYVFNVTGFSTYSLKDNDVFEPVSNITFPADGSIIDTERYARGQDNLTGTADDNKIQGNATDQSPSSGIVNVNVSIKSGSSGKYFDGNAFTSTSAIYLPANITSGFNTSSVTWEFYFNATSYLPDSFTITAKSRDSAGNQEHCPTINFMFLKDISVENAVPNTGGCTEKVCTAEFSGEWSITREKNTTIDGKGRVKVYISRISTDMIIVPLEEDVEVECSSGECTFGRIDKLAEKNKPGNNLVSTAKVLLLDSDGKELVEAEGGGEFSLAKALAGKADFANVKPNIIYVRPTAASVQVTLEDSICAKELTPKISIIKFMTSDEGKTICAADADDEDDGADENIEIPSNETIITNETSDNQEIVNDKNDTGTKAKGSN